MRTYFAALLCLLLAPMLMAQQPSATPAQKPLPAPSPSPAPPATPVGRIMTGTRYMTIFIRLERQLYTAIQHKDKAAISALLTDDFEVWTPNQNGDPIPLEEWLSEVTGNYDLKSFKLSQTSAKDFKDVVLYKFVLNLSAASNGKDQSGDYFVVDAWKMDGDSWKLSDRYISKITSQAAAPAAAKPTGKQ